MTELVTTYIGRKCILYTMNDAVTGTIQAIDGSWVSVDTGKEVQAVNLEFVVRISPCPEKKSKEK